MVQTKACDDVQLNCPIICPVELRGAYMLLSQFIFLDNLLVAL